MSRARNYLLKPFQAIPRSLQCMLLFVTIYLTIICSWPYLFPAPFDQDRFGMLESGDSPSKSSREQSILFIGGCPRSGTTLMRVLLDSHPSVACGPETHILPKLVIMHNQLNSPYEETRLKYAGISKELVYTAMRHFMLDIIKGRVKKGTTANDTERNVLLCNKDPFLINNGLLLKRLFPRAKFICMVRDGRAVAHSIIERKISITKFNLSSYESVLIKWNSITESMLAQCEKMGSSCMKVYYEKLVLNPKRWLEAIFRFLELPWDDSVLRHDQLIANGSIRLSTLERSTDQVIKPINPEALTSWVGKIPAPVLAKMNSIAPMLKILGYDPAANPPNYGEVDHFVQANMRAIAAKRVQWLEQSANIEQQRTELRRKLNKLGHDFAISKEAFNEEVIDLM